MIISHVVALSNNNVIGVDNNLPWNLKTDLSHFKEYTTNKVIVMGRKTYESIGKPLPNRLNYVVSQTINHIEGAFVFDSIESAIKNAPIWASVTFPSNISRIISDISSLVRFLLADT